MDSNNKVNILIVDDFPDNLVALKLVLDSPEYNIITASSGEEALKCLLENEFAVILLDVRMPGMDGFETARFIKQREKTRLLPIIFITAHGKDEKLLFDGYSAGGVDYISKPENPLVLKSKVAIFVELYRKTQALTQAEQKFRTIFENAVEGIYQATTGGTFISANPAVAQILKCEIPDNLIRFGRINQMHVDSRHYQKMLGLLEAKGSVRNFESKLRCMDGGEIWVCENLRSIAFENGKLSAYESFLTDITTRKKSEVSLKKSQMQLAAAQKIVQMGSWELDLNSGELNSSQELCRLIGVQLENGRLDQDDFYKIVHPDDREFVKAKIKKVIESGEPSHFEHRILFQGTTCRFVQAHIEIMNDADGNPTRVIGTIQDITNRKLAEEQLRKSKEQFRSLSLHLQSVREEERAKLSREIHDEFGQSLTAIKFELVGLEKLFQKLKLKSKNTESIQTQAKSMHNLIDRTIQLVRQLSAELRPAVLDLGVIPAIEWQSQEFQTRTGISCSFQSQFAEIEMGKQSSTAMFRIFQEALTNVARHAGADKVSIDLRSEDGHLILEVSDNGRGIDAAELSDPLSLGILGMRERASVVDGEVRIDGQPGMGTTVTVRIPVSQVN